MLAEFLPTVRNFMRQIVPPVIATLIAALLIAGYNRAFSGHLVQSRLAAMQGGEAAEARPAVATAKPRQIEYVSINDFAAAPEPVVGLRELDKGGVREAEKEQADFKVAEAPAPAARPAPRKPEPRIVEVRQPEPRAAAAPPVHAAPVHVAPGAAPLPPVATAPVIVARPAGPPPQEPVVIAAKPMVTVPDRPAVRPVEQAQIEEPVAPPQGPIGLIVNALSPSAVFARVREFGERIEAAGNDILPSIRQ